MASATQTTKYDAVTKTREVPVTTYRTEAYVAIEKRQEVVLTLTSEEAATIRALTAACGGQPESSRRKHTDAIGKALQSAGLVGYDGSDFTGSILFKNTVGI